MDNEVGGVSVVVVSVFVSISLTLAPHGRLECQDEVVVVDGLFLGPFACIGFFDGLVDQVVALEALGVHVLSRDGGGLVVS